MGNNSTRPGSGDLLHAAQSLDVDKVTAVLETGRGLKDRDLRRALFHSVEANHLPLLEALLTAGCAPSPHRPRDGFTPLHVAASNHLPQAAQRLVQSGADISKSDLRGRTPVWMAARLGAPAMLEVLLASPGCAINKPDKSGVTPLMVACSRGPQADPACVRLLLERGASATNQDRDGKSAAHYAAAAGDENALEAILSRHPEAARCRDNRQNTPLHYAAERGEQQVVATLLKHDSSVDAVNSKIRTPLWLASERGDSRTVTLLLRAQAQATKRDKYGWNALRAAVYSCNYDTVEVLLRSGCSVSDVCSSGISALHSAAFYDSKGTIARLLLDYGADAQLKDKKNKTPLQVAAEASNETVLRQLLALGPVPPAVLKRATQKCRDSECLQILNRAQCSNSATTEATPLTTETAMSQTSASTSSSSTRAKIAHLTSRLKPTTVYGSTGSTGESSSENCSEDASQRLRESRPPSLPSRAPSTTSTFTSRFTAMSASLSSSMRKSRKFRFKTPRHHPVGSVVSGYSGTSQSYSGARNAGLVPSRANRTKANQAQATTFNCISVSSRHQVLDLFNDSAQLEFTEGTLRCSTILYAKQIKSDAEQVQTLFNGIDNVTYPASAQLWSKPINIDIPGSPGELLLPARLLLRCALPLQGTDLRVYRLNAKSSEWDEVEIMSQEYVDQTVELAVQTARLGTFVVACCAGRSVQTVRSGTIERVGVEELKFWAGDDFSGVGLEITSPSHQGDVVCEIEPPIDFDQAESKSPFQARENVYHSNLTTHLQSHADCHPFVISLRLLDSSDQAQFRLHLPHGYCLGLKDPHRDSFFRRSSNNTLSLSGAHRLTVCVWKAQSNESAIVANRFHLFNIRAHFSLLRVGKNTFIHVASHEGENSRELTCAEMEKIEVRVGGCFRLDQPCNFIMHRGLLPLTVPLKMVKTSSVSEHVVPQMDTEDDLEELGGHIEIQGARRAVLLPLGNGQSEQQMEIDEPMDSY